jgi:hypothetical protein
MVHRPPSVKSSVGGVDASIAIHRLLYQIDFATCVNINGQPGIYDFTDLYPGVAQLFATEQRFF